MKPRFPLSAWLASLLALATFTPLFSAPDAKPAAANDATKVKPVRALLITGGGYHDYVTQAKLLTEAVSKIAPIEWTIVNEGGAGTRAQIPLYDSPNWAKPYDVVVHNECFADTTDEAYIGKILAGHKGGTAAVVIHCAMHTYRAAQHDSWREFLGVTTRRHDHQSVYPVKRVVSDHPALKDFPEVWTPPKDELYIIEKLWPGTKTLATSVSEKDGKEHTVIWTNDYHGTRVFGTTFGHGNLTWHDPVFVNYVARGVLWAAGR